MLRVLCTLLALGCPALAAQSSLVTIQEARLTDPVPLESPYFGFDVAISGDTAVVGRLMLLGPARRVMVYVRDGAGSWTSQAELTGDDVGLNDFGQAVDIDGDTAVATSRTAGAAYVFVRTGTTWTQQAKLVVDDGTLEANIATDVAISGDRVVIGASLANVGAEDTGGAFVFVRSGTSWSQEAVIVPDDSAAFDNVGGQVDIDGDTILVQSSPGVIEAHNVPYVFVHDGSGWTQQAKLLDPGLWVDGGLTIDGDTVLGGDANDEVRVFTRTGSTWSREATLTGIGGEPIGEDVALSGDMALIGSHDACSSGAAYLFERTGTTWSARWKFQSTDARAPGGDRFGFSLDIDAPRLVVGAYVVDHSGFTDRGAAYTFSVAPGSPGSTSCLGVGCPCGNDDPGAGCATSRGSGAELTATGTSSISADDLVLRVVDIPSPNANGLFFMGSTLVAPFIPTAADGYACTGGTLRFAGQLDDGVPPDELVLPNVASTAAALGEPVEPGCVRHFQSWFRDNNGSPCGGASNLSNVYTVTFNP